MAVLSTQAREDLSKKQFALPKQEKYPIPDLAHARNALARVSQFGSPAERKTVRSKVYNRYPELKENFQEREGESPTSKENLVREKLSAYGHGYVDILEKLGFLKEAGAADRLLSALFTGVVGTAPMYRELAGKVVVPYMQRMQAAKSIAPALKAIGRSAVETGGVLPKHVTRALKGQYKSPGGTPTIPESIDKVVSGLS